MLVVYHEGALNLKKVVRHAGLVGDRSKVWFQKPHKLCHNHGDPIEYVYNNVANVDVQS